MARGINDAGLAILKDFEKLRLKAYDTDGAGVWTIGWGHTDGVKRGDVCTKEQADAWLLDDLEEAESAVEAVATPLTSNEFSALVSLTYNIGAGAFSKSRLKRRLEAGDTDAAAAQFMAWNKAGGGVSKGLVRRRTAERSLFLTPDPAAELTAKAKVAEPPPTLPDPAEPTAPAEDVPMPPIVVAPEQADAMKQAGGEFVKASVNSGKRLMSWLTTMGVNIATAFTAILVFSKDHPVLVTIVVIAALAIMGLHTGFFQKLLHEADQHRRELAADKSKNNVR